MATLFVVAAAESDNGDSGRLHCRVLAVEADLAQPGLGLSYADRTALQALRFAAVLHSGAAVDHARPYATLRQTNVGGVAALLELLHSGGSSSEVR